MPTISSRAPHLLVIAVLVAGCGKTATPAPAPGPLQRLEVTPAAVLLTSASGTMALKVRGFDASGVEIPGLAPVFTSSRAAEVVVSTSGVVSALGTTGSALIVARVGEVEATPVTALVVRLKEGVLPIPDDQVAVAPVRLASSTPDSDQLRFALKGAPAFASGALLVGTGATALAGRVLAVRPVGGNTEVDLERSPATALVQDLSINLQFDPQHVRWQPEVRPSTQRASSALMAANSVTPMGVFECRSDADLAPLTGEFEASLAPSQVGFSIVDKIVDGQRVASEVIAEGTLQAKAKAVFRLGLTVNAAITCDVTLGRLTVPVAGLASVVVAPSLPLRFTSTLTGAVSVAAFTFGAEGTLTAAVKLGLRMTEGSDVIESFKTFDVTQDITPTVVFPFDAGVRAKAAIFFGLGSGLDISIGNVGLAALAAWNVIKLEAGPEFELKTGSPFDVALDPIYNTEYELKLKLAASPGDTIEKVVEHFFLSGKAVDLTAKLEGTLARSPQSRAVTVDKASFKAGDILNFTIALDPANVEFPVFGYDLSEVRIYRLSQDAPYGAQVIASMPALPGQTEFNLPWTATSPGDAVDNHSGLSNFYAFFVDVPFAALSDAFPFELGPAVPTVRSMDGAGLTWAPAPVPATGPISYLYGVAFAGESVAVAVGYSCESGTGPCAQVALRSIDAGMSWSPVALPSSVGSWPLRGIAFGDALHGVICGNQTLLTTADAGATWVVSGVDPSLVEANGRCLVRYVAPNTILLVADYNSTVRSADGGKTWRGGNAGAGAGYTLNNFDTDGKGVVLGSSGDHALWRSGSGGDSWISAYALQDTKYHPLSEVVGIVGFVGGQTFMAGSYGGVLRSTDSGGSWTKIAITTTPDAGGHTYDPAPQFDKPSFADSSTGVSTFTQVHYGTNGAPNWLQRGVVYTTDGGLTWIEEPGAVLPVNSSGIVFSTAGVGLAVTSEWIQGVGDVAGIVRSVPR